MAIIKKHVGLFTAIKHVSKFPSVKTKVALFKGCEHTTEKKSFLM